MVSAKAPRSLTLSDVARELGVSTTTVSMAFSGKGNITEKRRTEVLAGAREMGYEPNPLAQRLATRRAENTIALFSPALDASVTIHRIQHIQRLLNERNFDVEFHARPYQRPNLDDSRALLRNIRHSKPRALFVNAAWTVGPQDQDEVRAFMQEGGLVVVLAYNGPVALECDQSVQDETHSIGLAVRHLAALGHRKIGFTTHDVEQSRNGARQRFLDEMYGAGCEVRPEWIFSAPGLVYEAMGHSVTQQFLSLRERPTALISGVDRLSLMLANSLFGAGVQIPRDLSLVCLEDSPLLRSSVVPLSTVVSPFLQHGDVAVELLSERLEAALPLPPRVKYVRGELVVRQSSTPP